MTPDAGLERLLDGWLEDGPLMVADRVIDEVANRIHHQSQRPAWRLHRRFGSMNRSILFATAGGLALAIAVIALVVRPGASDGLGGPAPSTTASPTAAASPASESPVASTSTTAWWLNSTDGQCGEAPLPNGCAGPLEAGTHRSGGLAPAVTFTVPSGWVVYRDWRNYFALFPDTSVNRSALQLGSDALTDILVLPLSLSAASCPGGTAPSTWSSMEIAAALARQSGALGSSIKGATIDGVTGREVDLGGEPDWQNLCEGASPNPSSPAAARQRVILIDGPGQSHVAILLRSGMVDVFGGYVDTAMPVVETFNFDGIP